MASNNSSSEGGHVGSSEQWDRERRGAGGLWLPGNQGVG